MGNELVKDPCIRVLLDRREEIKKEVYKLQAEYKAIGELISRDYQKKWQPKKSNELFEEER